MSTVSTTRQRDHSPQAPPRPVWSERTKVLGAAAALRRWPARCHRVDRACSPLPEGDGEVEYHGRTFIPGFDSVLNYRVDTVPMRTSEVAAQAGVGVQTLRYYERRGLLPVPPRLGSGYRAYPPEAVRVVRFVKRAQQLGFGLDDIEELLELADGGPSSCATVRDLASGRIADLQRQIDHLAAMREALARLVDTCEQPRERRECPLLEAIDTAARGDGAQGGRG